MIEKLVESMRDEMIKTMVEMIPIKAISPELGGTGEKERADYLEKVLTGIGFDELKRLDAKDESGYVRPNIIAKIRGTEGKKTLWLAAHIDTVPEGDRSLWKTDPFKAVVEGDKIYGRGTADDGQAVVSSIYAVKALKESGVRPKNNVGLMLLADEEVGSKYGMHYVLDNYEFGKNDEFIVPDAGDSKGDVIEIAEKGLLWICLKVIGKQGHGSRPDLSLNANRIGMKLALSIDERLHFKFSSTNSIFVPPYSTFEPTKREPNVQNINTIPGTDVFCFDCRILPSYKVDDVFSEIKDEAEHYKKKFGVDVELNLVQKSEPAPETDPNSEVVLKLKKAIKELRGFEPMLIGIGGGTVAAPLRRKGYNAAVWFTTDNVEHAPNEYCKISNMVEDAKVFAKVISEY
ncbi:MAG: M20 family metallo-hydrolase [Nitrososphaeria archaeon]|nr:M20 family metallo-hydrolase [Conexivisphaerales archaeon]